MGASQGLCALENNRRSQRLGGEGAQGQFQLAGMPLRVFQVENWVENFDTQSIGALEFAAPVMKFAPLVSGCLIRAEEDRRPAGDAVASGKGALHRPGTGPRMVDPKLHVVCLLCTHVIFRYISIQARVNTHRHARPRATAARVPLKGLRKLSPRDLST